LRQASFYDAPHDLVIDRCISVDQEIPKCHDSGRFWDGGCGFGVDIAQLGKRLPNDFELPLNRRSKQVVSLVRLKRLAGDEPGNSINRLRGVP
jgi:hypothetical protein